VVICVDKITHVTCLLAAPPEETLRDAQIATKEGLPGFYRGFGAMLVGLVPASAAYFGG